MNKELNDLKRRFETFGIKLVVDDVKNEIKVNEVDGYSGSCTDDDSHDVEECDTVDELIDFCIAYKTIEIHAEPIVFKFDSFYSGIVDEFSEKHLLDRYEEELFRLQKVYPTIDAELIDLKYILETMINKYNTAINERLSLMEYKDGHVISYNYRASYQNKSMLYNWNQFTVLLDMKGPFDDILHRSVEELVSWMDMEMRLLAQNLAEEKAFKVGDIIRLADAADYEDNMSMVITEITDEGLECIRYNAVKEVFSKFTVLSPVHFVLADEGEFPELEPLRDYVNQKIDLVRLMNRIMIH